jgi:predicted 3-demethylubiquinone-9 3-methyltransferase (glyoxalase superfamily)
MAIDTYDWSARYGWLQDQFGVSWQVYTRNERDSDQTIAPCLLFTGPYNGSSEEALHFYTTVFRNSETDGIMHYPAGSGDQEGKVMHSQFRLNGQIFMAMDGGPDHAFQFNDGVSFMIHCDTQEEIDYYWIQLTQGGEESQCGWLKDRFGVSWQVTPTRLMEMLMSPDRAQADRVVKAFMHMRKLDLAALETAYKG